MLSFSAMALWLLAAFVVALVAFFTWLRMSVEHSLRREIDGLARARCPKCGAEFGTGTAEKARVQYLADCKRIQDSRRDVRIHFAYRWPVVCEACGARAKYHPMREEKLEVEASEPA